MPDKPLDCLGWIFGAYSHFGKSSRDFEPPIANADEDSEKGSFP